MYNIVKRVLDVMLKHGAASKVTEKIGDVNEDVDNVGALRFADPAHVIDKGNSRSNADPSTWTSKPSHTNRLTNAESIARAASPATNTELKTKK